MPELPEVETVVRGLRAVLPGRRILSVRLGKTNFIEDPAALERDLPGSRVGAVRRHGKFIVVALETSRGDAPNFSLLIHLGMTGQIVVGPSEAPVAPHTHVFFALDDGREFRYTDVRRFGKMRLLAGGTQKPRSANWASMHSKRRRRSFSRWCDRGARGSRRSCSIKACCAAWGTSTPTKACGARRSIRCASA